VFTNFSYMTTGGHTDSQKTKCLPRLITGESIKMKKNIIDCIMVHCTILSLCSDVIFVYFEIGYPPTSLEIAKVPF